MQFSKRRNATMMRRSISLLLPVLLCFIPVGCTGLYFRPAVQPPPEPSAVIARPAAMTYWTGIVFNGARIGFSNFRLTPVDHDPQRFAIDSELYLRLRFLTVDKRVHLTAHDEVRADLSLLRFHHSYDVDGSRLELKGVRTGEDLDVSVSPHGEGRTERLHLKGELYPASIIHLYPYVKGLAAGRRHRYDVYDGQTRTVAAVEQEVLGYEESDLFRGAGFKVHSRFQGRSTTTWIDNRGLPLLELSQGGVVISHLESEAEARRYIADAALAKDEILLDFSLIRTETAIAAPEELAELTVEISGLPEAFALPADNRQHCVARERSVICSVHREPQNEAAPESPAALQHYLQPTFAVTAHHPQISKTARAIVAEGAPAGEGIQALVQWMQHHIGREAVDVFTALDVLEKGRAECQGHALLYAAMARTLGIPTRVVNGIVYRPQFGGFLYHSWNESYVSRTWEAVDPTFGQVPADATHLKLVEGDSLAELAPLIDVVGKIALRIVSVEHRRPDRR
jgi:hypothetical protein